MSLTRSLKDRRFIKACVVLVLALELLACSGAVENVSDISETAQQVGDISASVDELGGTTGQYALHQESEKIFARLGGENRFLTVDWLSAQLFGDRAYAAACATSAILGACSSNQKIRVFSGCTVGTATFNGNVVLSYSNTGVGNCTMPTAGDYITRNPSLTVTGLRGATLTILKSGAEGQKVTRQGGTSFLFTTDGIRRVFTNSEGESIFDFTTTTVSGLTVTGVNRSGRVLNGGTLRILNNKTSESCDISPTNVQWEANCNCPTSGSWTGTCAGGKTMTLTYGSCGTAEFELDSNRGSVTLDRCYSL